MTVVPAGAQLAPVDLPPPPPHSDPREPSPTNVLRGRGASTPRKPHSPQPSRGTSPIRPAVPRAHSSELSPAKSASPPLFAPTPLSFRAVQAGGGHHSHSRPVSPAGSMHSSTSAIFERDIELPPVASLSLNPNAPQTHTLNHKSSRLSHLSHGSALDHTVPAVLDDAVEALAGSSRGFQGLEIESPAPVGSAMARQASAQASGRKLSTGPTGTSHSRSPSPISFRSGKSPVVSPTRSPPILGAISTNNPVGGTISPLDKSPASSFDAGNVPRPALPGRMSTGPQVPGAWSFGEEEDRSRKEEDKVSTVPSTDPIEEVAPGGPATAVMTAEETSSAPPPMPGNVSPAPAVPAHMHPADKRRISFISYNDLLSSAPTTVTNLSEITSGQLSPDHLPGTISPNVSSRSPVLPPPNPLGGTSGLSSGVGLEHKSSLDGQSASVGRAGLGLGGSSTGASAEPEGEWSRQGLGKGLEQRLEDLVQSGKAA